MRKQYFLTIITALAISLCLLAGVATGEDEEEYSVFMTSPLEPLQRPVSVFDHDAHNEKAELDDCSICHHAYTEDGMLDSEGSSEGIPCSDCHVTEDEAAEGATPLVKAYHLQCKNCHDRKGKGPRACGECHVRR